tara:strand:+ start:24 stop:686 length:663 start_codon:yes stop_codon:yes gene_type:complete
MDVAVIGTGYPEIIGLLEDLSAINKDLKFIGFLDDNPNNNSRKLYGNKIIGKLNWIKHHKDVYVINSIFRNPYSREQVTLKLKEFGAKFFTFIHPSASYKYASIGEGSIICRNCILEPGVSIGEQSVILHNTVISHDSKIGKYNFIGNNVTIQGKNLIGDYVTISAGSSTCPNCEIMEGSLIGINSFINKNIPERCILGSPPSRIIKTNQKFPELNKYIN